jgi:hypothetical protein
MGDIIVNLFRQAINVEGQVIEIQNFYNRIFDIPYNRYLRRIREIMLFKDDFGNQCILAAADFARRMVSETCSYHNFTDFQNFCSYFEYAFATFERRAYKLQLELEDYCNSLMSMVNNVPSLNDDTFISFCIKYHKDAALVHEYVWSVDDLDTEHEDIMNSMIHLAEQNAIKFVTLPSAVYHWRKHAGWDPDNPDYNIQPNEYFQRSNQVIRDGVGNDELEDKVIFNNELYISVVRKQWRYRLLSHRRI